MDNSKLKIINTEKAPSPVGPYNQCIIHNDTAYLSGQIAIIPETNEIIRGNLEKETHQVMKNILAVLSEINLNVDNIIKCSIFLSDMSTFAQVNEIYASYFKDYFPARECVEVACLPKNVNVEISVIAALN